MMDCDVFDAYYMGERMWTTVLSDGNTLPLKSDGAETPLLYSDRSTYISLVQESCMNQFNQQVHVTTSLSYAVSISFFHW